MQTGLVDDVLKELNINVPPTSAEDVDNRYDYNNSHLELTLNKIPRVYFSKLKRLNKGYIDLTPELKKYHNQKLPELPIPIDIGKPKW